MLREARIVFLAAEPLLLRRGPDVPVLDKSRGAVVVERGDAKNLQLRPPRRGCR